MSIFDRLFPRAPELPMPELEAPPKRKRNRERVDFDYLRAEEVSALLAVASRPRDRAILSTLALLGLRCNELRMLNVDDIDWEDGTLRVLQAKGGKQRLLPADDALPALKEWLAVRGESELDAMFIGRNGPHVTRLSNRQIRTLVKRYGYAAGVGKRIEQGLHPHALRHTCATLMLQNGVDLRIVQEWLGHSSPTVTAQYTSVDLRNKRSAAATLGRVLMEAAGGA